MRGGLEEEGKILIEESEERWRREGKDKDGRTAEGEREKEAECGGGGEREGTNQRKITCYIMRCIDLEWLPCWLSRSLKKQKHLPANSTLILRYRADLVIYTQLVSQSISRSINQSINQLINHSMTMQLVYKRKAQVLNDSLIRASSAENFLAV